MPGAYQPTCIQPVMWFMQDTSHTTCFEINELRRLNIIRGRIILLSAAAGATGWRRNVVLIARRVSSTATTGAKHMVFGRHVMSIYIYIWDFVCYYQISIMHLCAAVYDGGTQSCGCFRETKNWKAILWLMATTGTSVNDVRGVMCYNIILLPIWIRVVLPIEEVAYFFFPRSSERTGKKAN